MVCQKFRLHIEKLMPQLAQPSLPSLMKIKPFTILTVDILLVNVYFFNSVAVAVGAVMNSIHAQMSNGQSVSGALAFGCWKNAHWICLFFVRVISGENIFSNFWPPVFHQIINLLSQCTMRGKFVRYCASELFRIELADNVCLFACIYACMSSFLDVFKHSYTIRPSFVNFYISRSFGPSVKHKHFFYKAWYSMIIHRILFKI